MSKQNPSPQPASSPELPIADVLGLSRNPAFDPTRLRNDEYAELAQASRNRMLASAIAALFVEDGQQVQSGETLMMLDTEGLEIQLREAQAQVLKAGEALRQMQGFAGRARGGAGPTCAGPRPWRIGCESGGA